MIVDEFRRKRMTYERFAREAQHLLEKLLDESGVAHHKMESRVKSVESLERKISRPDRKYAELKDITDLVGLRVIVFFEEDIDVVAEIVLAAFAVDTENSVDKRSAVDPTKFGYKSLHFVVSMSDVRLGLPENAAYKGLVAEIQIRTVLQHGWAEIEHDLGYKYDNAPIDIKRRFARAASFIEVVDEEFCRIRSDLRRHEENIRAQISQPNFQTSSDGDDLNLDLAALRQYVSISDVLKDVDEEIAATSGIPVSPIAKEVDEREVKKLLYLGVDTLSKLDAHLKENGRLVVEFAGHFLAFQGIRGGRPSNSIFAPGIGIFYLCYLLVALKENEDDLRRFIEEFWKDNQDANEVLLRDIQRAVSLCTLAK